MNLSSFNAVLSNIPKMSSGKRSNRICYLASTNEGIILRLSHRLNYALYLYGDGSVMEYDEEYLLVNPYYDTQAFNKPSTILSGMEDPYWFHFRRKELPKAVYRNKGWRTNKTATLYRDPIDNGLVVVFSKKHRIVIRPDSTWEGI